MTAHVGDLVGSVHVEVAVAETVHERGMGNGCGGWKFRMVDTVRV